VVTPQCAPVAVGSGHVDAPAAGPVRLTVNGSLRDVADGTTLVQLLTELGLRVGSVVVEHNGTALLRSEVEAAVLADGDRLELVRAVAGG
jgi:sulfur carrier protein